MKKTESLNLNLWEGNDRVKRVDFVEDNLKIDNAYKDLLNKCEELEINIDNIDISEELENLNNEIIEKLNDKANKDHTHITADITETYEKNFVSTPQKLKINEIDNKADKSNVVSSINGKKGDVTLNSSDIDFGNGVTVKDQVDGIESQLDYNTGKIIEHTSEIDNLKQSGVESNKILVDALNSKKIDASTNDTIRANVTKVNDIQLGTGNVLAGEVLEGKTYSSNEGTDLVGTMPNRGILTKTLTTQGGKQILDPGYYSGGEISAQFPNLTPNNIKSGINIGGVTGVLKVPLKLDVPKISNVRITIEDNYYHKLPNVSFTIPEHITTSGGIVLMTVPLYGSRGTGSVAFRLYKRSTGEIVSSSSLSEVHRGQETSIVFNNVTGGDTLDVHMRKYDYDFIDLSSFPAFTVLLNIETSMLT